MSTGAARMKLGSCANSQYLKRPTFLQGCEGDCLTFQSFFLRRLLLVYRCNSPVVRLHEAIRKHLPTPWSDIRFLLTEAIPRPQLIQCKWCHRDGRRKQQRSGSERQLGRTFSPRSLPQQRMPEMAHKQHSIGAEGRC